MTAIANNISHVRQRIAESAASAGRSVDEITLVAVSKTRSSKEVAQAFNQGITDFGENYLQEAVEKISQLSLREITWHFIGSIQSNKTRLIAENFDWVHTVDRLKIAQRLADQRPKSLPPLNICIQLNLDNETTKSGVGAEELEALAEQISKIDRLKLRGIMAIPAPSDSPDQQNETCLRIGKTFAKLQRQLPDLDTLSLGMSADLEAAIAAGSTMVRVGTDIFGQRDPKTTN